MPRKKIDWLAMEREIHAVLATVDESMSDKALKRALVCIDVIVADRTGRGNALSDEFTIKACAD